MLIMHITFYAYWKGEVKQIMECDLSMIPDLPSDSRYNY